MQGSVHEMIGVGAVALLALSQPRGADIAGMHIQFGISIFSAALGSLLPDIDMTTTKMGHRHKITSKVVNKVGGGHRGVTHSLLIPALVLLGTLFLNDYLTLFQALMTLLNSLVFGFLAGYLLHIGADMFNGKGCPILWPISSSKIHIMDLPSSGMVPYIFGIVVLVLEFLILFGEEIAHVIGA